MHRKCPYLSTRLECFAGSFATLNCLTEEFHGQCAFKKAASKTNIQKYDKDELIPINF